jgi:hypothetical protein
MPRVSRTLVILAMALSGIGFELRDVARVDASTLGGGVLIAHHPAGMAYSSDSPREGWCAKYRNEFAITTAEQQVNRTDTIGAPVFWFVLSAWYEPKQFGGIEFGLGDYDSAAFVIVEHGVCGGPQLQIPNGAWPGPNTGIAIAAQDHSGWSGNYVPTYYFVGYAYAPGTRIDITGYSAGDHRANWATCGENGTSAEAVCLGAFGVLQDGIFCAPPPLSEIRGACCLGAGECQILLPSECADAGGTWNGSTACTGLYSCPRAAACCFHDERTGYGTCRMLTRDECRLAGGRWQPGEACDQGFTCPPVRACCVEQHCMLATERECMRSLRGIWIPNVISCDAAENPCVRPYVCCFGETCCLALISDCIQMCGVPRPAWDSCGPSNPCPGTPAAPRPWEDFHIRPLR